MGKYSKREKIKDNYTHKCEIVKRSGTAWALPSNENVQPTRPHALLTGQKWENGMFKNIHHGATPNTIRDLLVEKYFTKR